MNRSMQILATVAFSVGLSLVSCQQLPKQLGKGVVVEPGQSLEQLNPSDVVVAPIQVVAEGLVVPTRALRESLVRGLVKRRYAPLSLDFVDEAGMIGGSRSARAIGASGVSEASYQPGTLNEEVVAQLVVHAWDQALWETRRAFKVDIELRMIDPNSPNGPALWSGRLPGRFDYAEQESSYTTEGAFFRGALDQVLAEILAVMPARETRPEVEGRRAGMGIGSGGSENGMEAPGGGSHGLEAVETAGDGMEN